MIFIGNYVAAVVAYELGEHFDDSNVLDRTIIKRVKVNIVAKCRFKWSHFFC